jgi:hypothetical protein
MKIYFDGHKRLVIERSEESKRNSIFPRYLVFPRGFLPVADNFNPVKVAYQLEFLVEGSYCPFERRGWEAVKLKASKEEDSWLFPLEEAIQKEIWQNTFGEYADEESQALAREMVQAKRIRLKITEVISEPVSPRMMRTDFAIIPQGKVKLRCPA